MLSNKLKKKIIRITLKMLIIKMLIKIMLKKDSTLKRMPKNYKD